MKVCVAGGTGFIGSHTVRALHAAGHEIRLLARDPAKVARSFAGLDLAVVRGDMTDAATVRSALAGCDALVHAAATIGGPAHVIGMNVDGTHNLLGAASDLGLDPIVYLSSITALFPPRGVELTVDDEVGSFTSPYARSKNTSEAYARSLQAKGHPVTTIYPAGTYGPDDPGPGEALKGLRDRLRYGWPITTGGSSWVDVRDLAAMIVATLRPDQGPRRFMAGGHFMTWSAEADMCEKLCGRKVRRIRTSPRMLRAVGRCIDWLGKVRPIDYPLTREAALFITELVPSNSRATVAKLGIDFRPPVETARDTISWLLRSGHLAARYAPALSATATSGEE